MELWKGKWGGQADSKYSGVEGSFAESVGIDGHSEPGLIKVHQKLTKDSGATVSEFCKIAISASNGYQFWFSADSGKIWARDPDGTWTLAYTTEPTSGGTGCLGAREYNGFIWWATQDYLHRIAIGNADGDWGSDPNANWDKFGIGNINYHPMAEQDLTLFIGDSNYIAKVDSSFTTDRIALDINEPHTIKTLSPYDLDLLLGTFIADSVDLSQIIRWDTVDASWDTADEIPEAGVNAFIIDDNFVFVQAGHNGMIYFYNGEQLVPYKRIPGVYATGGSTQSVHVHPGSVGRFFGRPVFGVSNKSKNAAKQGIYSLGSYSKDYEKVLSGVEWVISQNKTEDIELGAIIVSKQELFAAWKDGSNYGVDKIDWNNKYGNAYLETMMLPGRTEIKTISEAVGFYATLRTGGINFSHRVNHGDWIGMTSVTNSSRMGVQAKLSVPKSSAIQMRINPLVSGNDAPEIEAIEVNFR